MVQFTLLTMINDGVAITRYYYITARIVRSKVGCPNPWPEHRARCRLRGLCSAAARRHLAPHLCRFGAVVIAFREQLHNDLEFHRARRTPLCRHAVPDRLGQPNAVRPRHDRHIPAAPGAGAEGPRPAPREGERSMRRPCRACCWRAGLSWRLWWGAPPGPPCPGLGCRWAARRTWEAGSPRGRIRAATEPRRAARIGSSVFHSGRSSCCVKVSSWWRWPLCHSWYVRRREPSYVLLGNDDLSGTEYIDQGSALFIYFWLCFCICTCLISKFFWFGPVPGLVYSSVWDSHEPAMGDIAQITHRVVFSRCIGS